MFMRGVQRQRKCQKEYNRSRRRGKRRGSRRGGRGRREEEKDKMDRHKPSIHDERLKQECVPKTNTRIEITMG